MAVGSGKLEIVDLGRLETGSDLNPELSGWYIDRHKPAPAARRDELLFVAGPQCVSRVEPGQSFRLFAYLGEGGAECRGGTFGKVGIFDWKLGRAQDLLHRQRVPTSVVSKLSPSLPGNLGFLAVIDTGRSSFAAATAANVLGVSGVAKAVASGRFTRFNDKKPRDGFTQGGYTLFRMEPGSGLFMAGPGNTELHVAYDPAEVGRPFIL